MPKDITEKALLVFLRLMIGWVFLWAGYRQVFLTPDFSVASFLSNTKTFHDAFAVFLLPDVVGVVSLMVKWGHLLIGLSLVSGFLVRLSAPFGIMLLGMYYFAHMDFPYIEGQTNLIVDYHLVYIAVLGYLILKNAGRICGLDGWTESTRSGRTRPVLAAA